MSIITEIIQPQSFEIVRDRIGRILAEELANQFVLNSNGIEGQVWIERSVQYDKSELIGRKAHVNVCFGEGSYGNQDQTQSEGTYKYYIDVYVNEKSNDTDRADVRASVKLQSMLGICRSILEDSRYKTLGFKTPPGFIGNRHYESIQIQNPNQKKHDGDSSLMGRLTFSVKVLEKNGLSLGVASNKYITTVKLDVTDKGYLWIQAGGIVYDTFDYSFDASF
jgi:hypothetical protein